MQDIKLKDLSDDDILNGKRPQLALGYKKNILPSFVLPKDDPGKLVIAQGSCRKMHGHGPDALAYLDDLIKKQIEAEALGPTDTSDEPDPDKLPARPQQLFLTGDQIYADEVPAFALAFAGNLAGALLIGNEKNSFS